MSASAVLKLQKVGFTIEQVEALADFMDTQAASKADLFKETAAIRGDLEGAEHRLETRIIETRSVSYRGCCTGTTSGPATN
jgi:hypothetical protein